MNSETVKPSFTIQYLLLTTLHVLGIMQINTLQNVVFALSDRHFTILTEFCRVAVCSSQVTSYTLRITSLSNFDDHIWNVYGHIRFRVGVAFNRIQ